MEKPVFNGIYKALTFRIEDGNFDDIRLIKIMNKYGLKGTFNINSGKNKEYLMLMPRNQVKNYTA